MAVSYQKAASRRKLIYFGIMVVLFAVTIFARGVVALPLSGLKDTAGKYTIKAQARELDLSESDTDEQGESQRDPELTGSAVRLLLTGSRGFAVCALWLTAYEKQMRQEWSELELTVNSITTLQPHFETPWIFQSWNLSYNVSVEMDRLNDMYFYIARGISLLSDGESINRYNPNMRYSIAFYYQNKFTVSDKVTTLRSLLHLSCMPAEDRNPEKYLTRVGGRVVVDEVKLRELCEKYPQFVRRLRESVIRIGKLQDQGRQVDQTMLLAPKAMNVIEFLRDNQKIPTRYSKDDPKRLDTRLKQFPVVPPHFANGDRELNYEQEWSDAQATAILAARAWFKYANEAIPPPDPVPGPTKYDYRDPERKRRIPRQPMLIIFRQGPPRAQTYLAADQLSKDGWFDSEPWVVDRTGERWFSTPVEIKPSATAREAWMEAHTMWANHGRENGLLFTNEQMARYQEIAALYANHRHFQVPSSIMNTQVPPLRPDEAQDPRMRQSAEANEALSFYYRNRQVTQYENFLNQAAAEMNPLTIRGRKLLYQAERYYRGDPSGAIAVYEQVLGSQKEVDQMRSGAVDDNRLIWPRVLMQFPEFARTDRAQEDTYEAQMRYLTLLQTRDRSKFKQVTMGIFEMMRAASPVGDYLPYRVAMTEWLLSEKHLPVISQGVEPFWPPGPFDGKNPETNEPWVTDLVVHRALLNAGLLKGPAGGAVTERHVGKDGKSDAPHKD